MWINSINQCYEGDCALGDREAIPTEILAFQQANAIPMFTAAIQQRLDDFARTRNYDSIMSACTYATSTIAKFKSEGQVCVKLRDSTWSVAYSILSDVQANKRPVPSSIADIESELPSLEWA